LKVVQISVYVSKDKRVSFQLFIIH